MSNKVKDEYTIYSDDVSYLPEDNKLKDSTEEIEFAKLSGDEGIEKGHMDYSCTSSVWAKRNSKASFLLTSVTIMKSMIGVGILGIPNVMKNFGVFPTLGIMLTILTLGITSSYTLLKSKNLSGRSNYSTIGFYIFRARWIIISINLVIALNNLSTCLSEIIIFKSTVQLLFTAYREVKGFNVKDITWYTSEAFTVVVLAILIFPLLIVKSIEKLKFVSLTAILSITVFTILVIYNFFAIDAISKDFSYGIPESFEIKSALTSLPTIILAYNWQFNFFPIFKGLERTNDKRFFLAMLLGYSLSSILYITVGVLGYATYGNDIETKYLASIDREKVGTVLYVILQLTFVASTTLTMPVLFFGGRNNIVQLLKSTIFSKKSNKSGLVDVISNQEGVEVVKLSKRRDQIIFFSTSVALFGILVVSAIFLNNLGLIYNIKGSIFCNFTQFIFPSLFYISLVKGVKKYKFKNEQKKVFYYGIFALFVWSWFLMIICVVCGVLPK